MASITRRRSEAGVVLAYDVRWRDQTGKQRSRSFKLAKQATAHKQKVEREIFDGVHVGNAPPFRELAELYLKDCDRRWRIKDMMSGNTLDLARRLTDNHLVPYFGAIRSSDITASQVREFVKVKAADYSRVTVGHLVTRLRYILQFGVEADMLKRNIVRDQPPRIPCPPSERREIPSIEQLRSLFEFVERREHFHRDLVEKPYMTAVAVYLAATAGLRRGEICALLWENVDLDGDTIRVRHNLSRFDGMKGPKTAAGVRDVPIVPGLRRALVELRARQGGAATGPVLRTRYGKAVQPGDLSSYYWEPVAKRAGLIRSNGRVFGLHTLRHGAASMWIRAGLPALALKKAIGHASVTTTMDVYGHLFPEDDQTRIAVFASAAALTDRARGAESERVSA